MSSFPAGRMRGFVIDSSGRPLGIQRAWPMLVLRGALMAALGIATLVWPALTATALVVLWGVFLALDGISSILFGLSRRRGGRGGGGWLFQGVVALVVGAIAIAWPAAVAYLVLLFAGLLLLLFSTIGLAAGLAMRRVRSQAWGWAVGFAVVGIVLSLMLIVNPLGGAVGLVWLFGILLVLAGFALIGGGLRVRRMLPA